MENNRREDKRTPSAKESGRTKGKARAPGKGTQQDDDKNGKRRNGD